MNNESKKEKRDYTYIFVIIAVVAALIGVGVISSKAPIVEEPVPQVEERKVPPGTFPPKGTPSEFVSLNNKTPEGAAKMFLKAMITHDAKMMKKINHSDINYPPNYCLQMSTEGNWSKYDLDKYRFEYLGDGKVEYTYPDERPSRLSMVEENGSWYFYDFSR